MPDSDQFFRVGPALAPRLGLRKRRPSIGMATLAVLLTSAVQLTPDLSATVGEPVRLFHGSDAPWSKKQEPHGCHVTDGPWLHRTASGRLVMLWSSFTDTGYAVGIATSESGKLAGPWKQSAEPLFDGDGGHPMLFRRFDGQLMLALHSPNETPLERERILEVNEVGDTLALAESGLR